MGFVMTKVWVHNPSDTDRAVEVEFLVDTGAIYSSMPEHKLREIHVEPRGEREFRQASGRAIIRAVGEARFRYGEYEGISPVIFGRKSDRPLLGVVTLEVLGLEVDPVSRTLKPTPLLLLTGGLKADGWR